VRLVERSEQVLTELKELINSAIEDIVENLKNKEDSKECNSLGERDGQIQKYEIFVVAHRKARTQKEFALIKDVTKIC
jgi:hypothetical protein